MRTATHGAIRICRIPCGKPPHLLTNLGGRSTTKAAGSLCNVGMVRVGGGAVFRKFLGASCNRSPFQTIQEARSVVEQFGCEVQISPAKFQDLRHFSSGEDRVRELQRTLDISSDHLSRLQPSKQPSWETFLQGSGGCQLGWCERPSSLQEDQAKRRRTIQATLVCYCPPGACCAISGELLLDGASCDPPPGHSVYQNGRCFAVLPWKAPGDSEMGMDMVKDFDDNWLDIPAGWKPYEVCQDFEQGVLPKVIAANSWGTDMVIVCRGNKWPGWKTGVRGSAAGAGKRLSPAVRDYASGSWVPWAVCACWSDGLYARGFLVLGWMVGWAVRRGCLVLGGMGCPRWLDGLNEIHFLSPSQEAREEEVIRHL
eukprot:s7208_g5.t1